MVAPSPRWRLPGAGRMHEQSGAWPLNIAIRFRRLKGFGTFLFIHVSPAPWADDARAGIPGSTLHTPLFPPMPKLRLTLAGLPSGCRQMSAQHKQNEYRKGPDQCPGLIVLSKDR